MTNAEWMIKNGYKFSDLWITRRDCAGYRDDTDERTYIITINGKDLDKYIAVNETTYLEVMLKWLDMEHKEPILDDVEKRYLSAVIKPFRNRIKYICKIEHYNNKWDLLYLGVKNESDMDFPKFKHGTGARIHA
jgi:hypothetical protein